MEFEGDYTIHDNITVAARSILSSYGNQTLAGNIIGQGPRLPIGEIDADLAHDLYDLVMNPIGRRGSGGEREMSAMRLALEELGWSGDE